MHIKLPQNLFTINKPELPERVKLQPYQPYQQNNSISAVAILHALPAEQ